MKVYGVYLIILLTGGLVSLTSLAQAEAIKKNIPAPAVSSRIADAVFVAAEAEATSAFNLFPNPAHDFIQINYASAGLTAPVSVSVYNAIGRVVRTFSLAPEASGVFQKNMPLTDFAAGVYFVRLKVGPQTIVKKFVKVNF